MITLPNKNYHEIRDALVQSGLYAADSDAKNGLNTWRISLDPYFLTSEEVKFFEGLGSHLLKFYTVLNKFYQDSARGKLPPWIAEYLNQGKPQELIEYARMKRFKSGLPGIIRPDVIVTEKGFAVTELDSVPGGFGLTAQLMGLYGGHGDTMVGGGAGGIPDLFYEMLESVAGAKNSNIAIVVSEEAKDYWTEMVFLADLLREKGFPVFAVRPEQIIFKEEGLFIEDAGRFIRLDALYRFFELFDLKNIPKSELILYANKKGRVKTNPPFKPHLEEKLSFALFHHPSLAGSWEKALGDETFELLSHLIPKTWVLDNRELPPHGVIPGLIVGGSQVRDWKELHPLTQKERQLVIKPSGFSALAWGSRGVVIGHDVSSEDWVQTLEDSLRSFPSQPSILQEFHKGKSVKVSFVNPETHSQEEMMSRVRLTPYYFVVDGAARLGGILATLCPSDKKKIHGMVDAVMVPCALRAD